MCYLSHTIFAYSVAITFYFTSMGTQTGSNLLSNENQSSAHKDIIQYNCKHIFTNFLTEEGCFPPPPSLEDYFETSLLQQFVIVFIFFSVSICSWPTYSTYSYVSNGVSLNCSCLFLVNSPFIYL